MAFFIIVRILLLILPAAIGWSLGIYVITPILLKPIGLDIFTGLIQYIVAFRVANHFINVAHGMWSVISESLSLGTPRWEEALKEFSIRALIEEIVVISSVLLGYLGASILLSHTFPNIGVFGDFLKHIAAIFSYFYGRNTVAPGFVPHIKAGRNKGRLETNCRAIMFFLFGR